MRVDVGSKGVSMVFQGCFKGSLKGVKKPHVYFKEDCRMFEGF